MTKDSQNMVVARNIKKTYSLGEVKVHALKGVDFSIKKGEMVAVLGHSGSGKTTLLNCLSGLDKPTDGEITLGGRKLSEMSDNEKSDFRANKMGFVFQGFNLFSVLTAVENVELPLIVSGTDSNKARKKAMEMLDLVGLKDWADHKPSELSGGQQQRVAVARALVNDPEILWADEPTGNLDTTNSDAIFAMLKELNKTLKSTFIIVTHNKDIANAMDRTIVLRNGLIVDEKVNLTRAAPAEATVKAIAQREIQKETPEVRSKATSKNLPKAASEILSKSSGKSGRP